MKALSVVAPLRSVLVTASVGLAFGATALLTLHYLAAARGLAGENAQLKDQMQSLVERLAELEGEMGQVAAARRQVDRTTLAGLGSVLEHAGIDARREAGLARAMAPVEDAPGLPPPAIRTVGWSPDGGTPSFVALLDRMGDARDRAGRLAVDLTDTAAAVTSRRQILRSLPSVLPAKGKISSEFGMRESPFHPGFVGMHNGIDVAAEEGTPVTATADGVVAFAGASGSFGKLVTVDHGFGVTTKYGHNSLLLVKKGERVVRGQSIATVGNTGRSTGAHVHYEIALYDKPVDPRRFLFDAAPEDTAPQAAPARAHLALGGDAPLAGGVAAVSASEWDAPVFAVQGGILFAHAPYALHRATTGDMATAALSFLLLAVAGAVVRVPNLRKRKKAAPEEMSSPYDPANAELIRAFQRKEALKQQAAEF